MDTTSIPVTDSKDLLEGEVIGNILKSLGRFTEPVDSMMQLIRKEALVAMHEFTSLAEQYCTV